LIELYSKGDLIDRDYINLPNTYIYKRDLADIGEMAVMAIHIADPKCAPKKSCLVDGIWQISDVLTEVRVDTEYDKMRIATITGDTITMDNKDNTIILSTNVATVLAENYRIKAIDSEAPKYYIFKPIST